jgi:hypothetical protein
MGEDDAVGEFAGVDHRVPDAAARIDRVEDLLMTVGDRLTGVHVPADRDEVRIGRERCAEGRAVGGVPGVLEVLDDDLGDASRFHDGLPPVHD